MVLAHQVVGELSAVSITEVWTVSVNFDANFVGLAKKGIIEKSLTVLVVIHLVFCMQMIKVANSWPPNLPKK